MACLYRAQMDSAYPASADLLLTAYSKPELTLPFASAAKILVHLILLPTSR